MKLIRKIIREQRKLFKAGIVIVLLISVGLVIYGKWSLHASEMDSQLYREYFGMPYEEYSLFYDTDGLFDHSIESTREDMEEQSAYILVVTALEGSKQYGNAYISQCSVDTVIKGEGIEEGMVIHVYDLSIYGMDFDGSLPLETGTQYLVFLNDAPRPAVKNAYMYSSTWYGHLRIDGPSCCVKDDPEEILYIRDLLSYDHVVSDEEEKELFLQTAESILSHYQIVP